MDVAVFGMFSSKHTMLKRHLWIICPLLAVVFLPHADATCSCYDNDPKCPVYAVGEGAEVYCRRPWPSRNCHDLCGRCLAADVTCPVIQSLPAVVDVSEATVEEVLLHTLNVTDEDGDHVTCTASPAPSGPFLSVYDADDLTLAVYLSANPGLNHGVTSSYQVEVTCLDTDGNSDSQMLTVNVVDVNQRPTMTQTHYAVWQYEGLAGTAFPDPGYIVSDPDGDLLTYSFGVSSDSSDFHIDNSTGVISFARDVDFDDTTRATVYTWLVVISDPTPLSVTATVTGSILDINDNIPVFSSNSYSSSVASNTPVGSTILTLSATDADISSIYKDLIYNISGTSLLAVDNTGHIFLFASLIDYVDSNITATIAATNPVNGSYIYTDIFIHVYQSNDTPNSALNNEESWFDDLAHIALVALLAVIVVMLLAGLAYLVYTNSPSFATAATPKLPLITQVAPVDTKHPPPDYTRPVSVVSTDRNVSTARISPIDVGVNENSWDPWASMDWRRVSQPNAWDV